MRSYLLSSLFACLVVGCSLEGPEPIDISETGLAGTWGLMQTAETPEEYSLGKRFLEISPDGYASYSVADCTWSTQDGLKGSHMRSQSFDHRPIVAYADSKLTVQVFPYVYRETLTVRIGSAADGPRSLAVDGKVLQEIDPANTQALRSGCPEERPPDVELSPQRTTATLL